MDLNAPSIESWTNLLKTYTFRQANVHQLIANYLIAAGYKETVQKFNQEANASPTVDPCCLDVRVRIVKLIGEGAAQDAAQLVECFFPGLLEKESSAKFQLLQLHLIELIRAGCVEDALTFAQTLAFEIGERPAEIASEIERTLALLIFDNVQTSPFRNLLEQSHRDKVARTVNEAILRRANQEHPASQLENLFRMLLWCQAQLLDKGVRFVGMKDIATATFELK